MRYCYHNFHFVQCVCYVNCLAGLAVSWLHCMYYNYVLFFVGLSSNNNQCALPLASVFPWGVNLHSNYLFVWLWVKNQYSTLSINCLGVISCRLPKYDVCYLMRSRVHSQLSTPFSLLLLWSIVLTWLWNLFKCFFPYHLYSAAKWTHQSIAQVWC